MDSEILHVMKQILFGNHLEFAINLVTFAIAKTLHFVMLSIILFNIEMIKFEQGFPRHLGDLKKLSSNSWSLIMREYYFFRSLVWTYAMYKSIFEPNQRATQNKQAQQVSNHPYHKKSHGQCLKMHYNYAECSKTLKVDYKCGGCSRKLKILSNDHCAPFITSLYIKENSSKVT